jgi:hypothetical protein
LRVAERAALFVGPAEEQDATVREQRRRVVCARRQAGGLKLREALRGGVEEFGAAERTAARPDAAEDEDAAVGQHGGRVPRARVAEPCGERSGLVRARACDGRVVAGPFLRLAAEQQLTPVGQLRRALAGQKVLPLDGRGRAPAPRLDGR